MCWANHRPLLPVRPQILLFLLSWITFGWFHQGGGWNQNARFAEVRAIVEEGRFAIDNFLIYRVDGDRRVREPVKDATYVQDGETRVLCWSLKDPAKPVTVWPSAPAPIWGKPVELEKVGASGDVGFSPDGHFHSNKPPGTSLLAVPVYFVAYHLERAFGFDPDHWWILNVNLWLCSMFTVGLASAIAVVLVWRIGADLFPEHKRAALGAALCFGFGTTFFPFGTLLFDHNLTTALLLGAFASVRRDRPILAGALAGVAAVTNYLAAIPGVAFGIWALSRRRSHAWRYLAGVVPPAIVLLTYNTLALGSPFSLNTDFQNPMFKETAPAFLGMFTAPSWFAMQVITISPWRGIFVLSPVLILAIVALVRWPQHLGAERRVIIAIAAFFFVVNICFNGFHGGNSSGPRYLIPAIAFLCIGLVPALAAWPIAGTLRGVFGLVQQSLLTATDAMSPLGVSDHAWQNHPDEWKEKLWGNSIVWKYAWPLFSSGRAWPVIKAEFKENAPYRRQFDPNSPTNLGFDDTAAWERVIKGDADPLPLAAMPGPVSVNVVGPGEGGFFQQSAPHSPGANWASFNAGEFFFPARRCSLVPLGVMWGLAGVIALRRKLRR